MNSSANMILDVAPRTALRQDMLDLGQIHAINLSGRGGQESSIASILSPALGWNRITERRDCRLSDYCHEASGLRVEVKKQQNDQWFDIGKYHDLSISDQEIIMLFLNHNRGAIVEIAAIRLDDFVKLVTTDPECRKRGWTREVMAIAHTLYDQHPALQFKVKAKIRDLVNSRTYRGRFDILFDARIGSKLSV